MACRLYNQSQTQCTLTDQRVPVEGYLPICNENQRHQQSFDPRLFIVSGLRNTTANSILFKYVKSMTGGDLKKVTLLEEGKALVEVGKDISGFQKLKSKIRSHKLEGRQLKILRVYACDSIFVSSLSPAVTRDTILLYFENVRRSGGGEVRDVTLCKARNSAVVAFLNPEVIDNVVQKEHFLESQKLTVMKYFPQIDMKNINTLSGVVSLQSNDEAEKSLAQNHVKPMLVKRLCTSCKVDDDIMQFIMNGVNFQEFENKLDELNSEIEWNTGSDSVTIWKKADSSYVKRWANRCETALDGFFDRFDKLSVPLEELERSVQKAVSVALSRLTEMIPPEKALWKHVEEKQELLLVCLKEERISVLQTVAEFVEKIKEEEIRKMYQKETVRDINHDRLLFLKHIGFVEKIKEKNPELEVTLDLEKCELNFDGPQEQFILAKIKYCETMKEISVKILDLPSSIASIISTEPGKRYIDELLVQEKISAILLSGTGRDIRIVAATSHEYSRALNCLCNSVREAKVPFPSVHSDFIFDSDKWKEISTENLNSQLIHLSIDHVANLIVLQGATDIVDKLEKEITEYIESQRIKELKKIVTHGMARFLKENLSNEVNDIKARLKIDQVTIGIMKTPNCSFILCRGTKSGVLKCDKSVSELCRTVTKKEKDLSLPGLSQFLFSENGQRNLKVIEIENNVVIEMTKRSREYVKETSQAEVESLREELKERKKRLSLVQEDRSKCASDTKSVESTYDLCNFTTKEGLRISWKYGNIADETADILVNSAHSDLSHPTACGKALNKVGGPSFIQVCRDQDTIEKGSVLRTSGGNLSCKYVLHAVCCSWDGHQGKSEELLHKLMKSILRKCKRNRATSLAMPAIGTGKHMFPEDVVFRVLREEFKIFSFSQTTFTMRDIRVIVFAKQLATQPALCRPTMDRSRRISFGSVHVSLLEGDITQHPANAIINVLPRDLQLSNGGGVCKSILRAGGQAVQQQLNTVGEILPNTMVYVTTAGSISNSQKILHIVPTATDIPSLQASIGACLNKAKFLSLVSVSVSAIGTGPFGVTPRNSAEIILSAAKKFSTSNFPLDINIVVFQRNMVHDFETVIQENATMGRLSAPHSVGALGSARDSSTQSKTAHSTSSSQSADTARGVPLSTAEPKQTVNLEVFGRSSETIDASFEEIDTFIKNHTTTKEMEHEKVFEMFLEHWSKVEKLARDHDVKITCERSSIALIEGFVTNVSDCKVELMLLINESVEKQRKVNQLRYISKNIQWYYFQDGRTVEYDSELNGLIETASMENKQVLEITKFGEPCEIDLTLMMEKNTKSGQTERIKRKLIGETGSDTSFPPTWDPQPRGQVVHLISLSRSLPEYKKVLELFITRGGSGGQVTNIERIQNPCLYSAFLAAKKSMNGADNEMQLFHGTSAGNTESINANNFSRSFAGVNGVAYGNGVYFARDSSYSLRYSQLHGSSGSSLMYVAKVLVGQYTIGSKGIKAPPYKNDPSNPGVRYDSVVDNCRNPSIFVIFVDNHCYPEYLITFIDATTRA